MLCILVIKSFKIDCLNFKYLSQKKRTLLKTGVFALTGITKGLG